MRSLLGSYEASHINQDASSRQSSSIVADSFIRQLYLSVSLNRQSRRHLRCKLGPPYGAITVQLRSATARLRRAMAKPGGTWFCQCSGRRFGYLPSTLGRGAGEGKKRKAPRPRQSRPGRHGRPPAPRPPPPPPPGRPPPRPRPGGRHPGRGRRRPGAGPGRPGARPGVRRS